jgi:hypothetical protein
MAPRTDRTTCLAVNTDHAAKGPVFVNSRNGGNSKNMGGSDIGMPRSGPVAMAASNLVEAFGFRFWG